MSIDPAVVVAVQGVAGGSVGASANGAGVVVRTALGQVVSINLAIVVAVQGVVGGSVGGSVSGSIGASTDGGTSVGGIVRWANIIGSRREGTSSWNTASHFRIAKTGIVLAAALPEASSPSMGVVVGRTWTIALLFLVVLAKEELNNGRDEEKDSVNVSNKSTSVSQ